MAEASGSGLLAQNWIMGFLSESTNYFTIFLKAKKKPPIDLSFLNLKDKEQKRNHPFIYPSFSWVFFQPAPTIFLKEKKKPPIDLSFLCLFSPSSRACTNTNHHEAHFVQIIMKHITDEPAQTQIIMKHLTD